MDVFTNAGGRAIVSAVERSDSLIVSTSHLGVLAIDSHWTVRTRA